MAAAMQPSFPPEATRVSFRRFVAHLADGVVATLIFVVIAIPAAIVSDVLLAIVLVLFITVGQVAYFVLTQRGSGKSPGKHLVGIRVVDAGGATPPTGALVRRSIPLIVEYFYILAWASMMTSHYRQRFGDRWGKTYVVGD
jgi:uncharacterized RDD family membrane protein YckC